MADQPLKLSFILLITTVLIDLSVEQQCNAGGLRKLDGTVAKLVTIGNSGRKFPESKGDDLKKFCDQSEVYIKEIDRYKSKCMKDLTKQVTGVLVYSIKNAINQLCRKDSKKLTELIASTPCLNTGNAEINKCYTKVIDSILGIQHAEDKKKIPHVCCEYFKIFPCLVTRTKRIPACTPTHVDSASDFIRSLLGNVIDLICGEYTETSDKCESLGLPPKKTKNQRRTKSFFIPVVDVLSSFPEV